MKRTRGVWILVAALCGAICMDARIYAGEWGPRRSGDSVNYTRYVPGVQGPWGTPIPVAAPYSSVPANDYQAQAMMAQSVPLDMVQMNGMASPFASGISQAAYTGMPGMNNRVMQASGSCPPGGCPPAMMLPGGGMAPPGVPAGPGMGVPGAVAATGALTGPGAQRFPTKRTEVRFCEQAGMKVSWYAPSADGKTAGFSSNSLDVPGRYNFVQAAIYRLKLSNIPGRPGLELYPTLEVVPSNCKTDPFLAHSAVPVGFTNEDLDQVAAGNFVVKVIYLPDPQYQDWATTGPECVVSTRLEPGVDPIAEACRRGSILLVVRLGNIDLEAPNTPAMDAPSPYQAAAPAPNPAAMAQGMPGAAGQMVPYAGMGQMGRGPMGQGMPGAGQMGPYGAMGQMPPGAMGQMPPGMGQMPQGMAPMMGPNGQMMMMGPNGQMPMGRNMPIMGPNGQVTIMTPNGPVTMSPPASGPIAGAPGTPPGATLPPANAVPLATPPGGAPTTAPGAPTTQLPTDDAAVKQAKATSTPSAAPQDSGQATSSDKKPAPKRRWW